MAVLIYAAIMSTCRLASWRSLSLDGSIDKENQLAGYRSVFPKRKTIPNVICSCCMSHQLRASTLHLLRFAAFYIYCFQWSPALMFREKRHSVTKTSRFGFKQVAKKRDVSLGDILRWLLSMCTRVL